MLWVSRYNLCSLQLDTILILLLFCLFQHTFLFPTKRVSKDY